MPDGTTRARRGRLLLAFLLVSPFWLTAQSAPSPEQFFGFKMGAETKLADWSRMAQYLRVLDRASDRLVVHQAGTTTMGRPYLLAILSTPDTVANLRAYQDMQKKLADPRRTSQAEADRIAREGKAVVLIGMNVHSNEISGSQAANDLIYRLATEKSAWVDNVLNNAVVLIIPSQNPDGQQMVVDWYAENLDTPFADSPLPELFHKYAGHDNNRDSYMLTQPETQILNRITYKDWLPEVYLDVHQMSSTRARIFVPPFKDPPNPNVEPLIWSEVGILGQAMGAKLNEAGKPGVMWGDQYTGFWEGANSTNPWWHNIVALLTETASARLATMVMQERARPGLRATTREAQEVDVAHLPAQDALPAPADTQYRMNYPRPWLGGPWSPADVVEYQTLSTYGLLEAVANNREMLKRNFYLMNRRTVEEFRGGRPYAFVIPPEQRDPVAAAKLLSLIQAGAGEVHRAETPFVADGRRFPAGSHVVTLAQPFGRWLKDLLEPQVYPDTRPPAAAYMDYPYDVTAWSLGMLMGVDTVQVEEPFDAKLTLLTLDVEAPAGTVTGNGSTFIIGHETNNSIVAMNRLLSARADIEWAHDDITVEGRTYKPGAIIVRNAPRQLLEAMARDLKLNVQAVTRAPERDRTLAIRAPRVAVFEPWGGAIDSGWTRWLFEQYELPYTQIRNVDVLAPNLQLRFDVVVLPEMPAADILNGLQGRNVKPEHRGGIGQIGVRNLRRFVETGGTLVTLGNSAQFALQQLELPVRNVVRDLGTDSFFCPGSILRVEVDTRHPVGYGMPDEADAVFFNNLALAPVSPPGDIATSIARYPRAPLLRSGWLVGENRIQGAAASMEVAVGGGRVIMHAFRVQHRGQTWGTFKLLFNSVFYGPAAATSAPSPTFNAAVRR
jgi:hypothetical protein